VQGSDFAGFGPVGTHFWRTNAGGGAIDETWERRIVSVEVPENGEGRISAMGGVCPSPMAPGGVQRRYGRLTVVPSPLDEIEKTPGDDEV
jgi:hypothetical protein